MLTSTLWVWMWKSKPQEREDKEMYERIIMNLVETLQRIFNLKKCIHTLTYEYNIKAKRYSVCAGIMTIAEAQTPLGLIELLTLIIDYELSTIKQEQ